MTNNHVVGAEFYIKEYKKKHGGKYPLQDSIPNNLIVRVYGENVGEYKNMVLPLYHRNRPVFKKYYSDSTKDYTILDVVSIPFPYKRPGFKIAAFQQKEINKNLLLVPSTELFIIGFPMYLADVQLYPVWKRGTIANDVLFNEFLIDATTKKGMSGSPVVYRDSKLNDTAGITQLPGNVTFLVGILSSGYDGIEIQQVIKLDKIIEELSNSGN